MNKTPSTEREAAIEAIFEKVLDIASEREMQPHAAIGMAVDLGYSAGRAASTADVLERAVERVKALFVYYHDLITPAEVLEILEELKIK